MSDKDSGPIVLPPIILLGLAVVIVASYFSSSHLLSQEEIGLYNSANGSRIRVILNIVRNKPEEITQEVAQEFQEILRTSESLKKEALAEVSKIESSVGFNRELVLCILKDTKDSIIKGEVVTSPKRIKLQESLFAVAGHDVTKGFIREMEKVSRGKPMTHNGKTAILSSEDLDRMISLHNSPSSAHNKILAALETLKSQHPGQLGQP